MNSKMHFLVFATVVVAFQPISVVSIERLSKSSCTSIKNSNFC